MTLLRLLQRHRDFRLLLFGTVLTNLVMPAQFMSLAFWSIDTYPDNGVLVTGLMVAFRGVGMLACSLLGGAIADRFERRRVLLCCELLAVTVTALMAGSMIWMPFGGVTVLAILALVFLSAAIMAIDGPSRSASIPAVVPPAEMGSAIGLSNVAQQLTFPVVLPVIGILNQTLGPGQVVAVSLGAWVLIIPIIASLRYSSRALVPRAAGAGFIGEIKAGLGYARRDATILAVIAMVVIMQVVGMPGVGMLGPVWMTEVLGLSRAQFGFVAMLWGVGAVASSVTFVLLAGVPRRGATLAAMVLLFGACGIVFGHSRVVWVTAVANFGIGFAMAGALVTAMTIIQYTVVEEMRGRVMGLFPLVMGFSMLAVGPVSYAGQEFSLERVVPTLEWAALGLGVVVTLFAPGLRRVRPAARAAPPLPAATIPEPVHGGG
ncbi:MAG: MFS transporter [Dehalococcoidia bacterium]